MKKIFFSFLAIAALASCAKTEAVFTEGNSEIQIAPVTSMTTKANVANVEGVIDGIAYPTGEKFKVNAYWTSGNDSKTYFQNIVFGYKSDVASWGGNPTQYWPKNGELRFAAYSPSSVKMVHDSESDVYTLNDFLYTNNTADTYEVLVAPTTKGYTAATAADKVSVVFEHALSWITFKVKSTPVANGAFTITGITLDDANTSGDMTADMVAGTKTWETETPLDVTVFTGSRAASTTAVDYENVAKGLIVLPQATTTVTVNFTQNATASNPALEGQSITIPLTLENNQPWEAGKHYTYTIVFDLDEILINPSVEDWEETDEVIISSDPVEVKTAEELATAIAEGKDVVLEQSIALENSLIVANPFETKAGAKHEFVIDLNGNDIIVENNSADYEVGDAIVVKDNCHLTIKGEGKVQANTRAVWVRGVDSEVVIEGGEFVGSVIPACEVIYVSGANGKITINGGTFKAAEEDKTSFAKPQYAALNIYGNGAKGQSIVVYGGSFYKFDPANNVSENPVEKGNFVAAGYNVINSGDWYTVNAPEATVVLTGDATVTETYDIAGGILDGANHTFAPVSAELSAKFFTASTSRLINTVGNATIKNVIIDGKNAKYGEYGIRGIFATGAGVLNIENTTIKNVTYTINDDSVVKTLNVTNSTLEGWTSYNPGTIATFKKVTFKAAGHKTFRPHGKTFVTDCAFEDGMVILLDKLQSEIVFENCTYAGRALTADDLSEVAEVANVVIK